MAKPTGRPTKFSAEMQRQALVLAKVGFTDDQMSEVLGITKQTLNNWKKSHPAFFDLLKTQKKQADEIVVRSLYERACGYEHPDTHISNYQGKITITGIVKHYPPDPVSMIFWLKNRDRENWRDKQDLQIGLDESMLQAVLSGMSPERAESVKKELIALAMKKKKA